MHTPPALDVGEVLFVLFLVLFVLFLAVARRSLLLGAWKAAQLDWLLSRLTLCAAAAPSVPLLRLEKASPSECSGSSLSRGRFLMLMACIAGHARKPCTARKPGKESTR